MNIITKLLLTILMLPYAILMCVVVAFGFFFYGLYAVLDRFVCAIWEN